MCPWRDVHSSSCLAAWPWGGEYDTFMSSLPTSKRCASTISRSKYVPRKTLQDFDVKRCEMLADLSPHYGVAEQNELDLTRRHSLLPSSTRYYTFGLYLAWVCIMPTRHHVSPKAFLLLYYFVQELLQKISWSTRKETLTARNTFKLDTFSIFFPVIAWGEDIWYCLIMKRPVRITHDLIIVHLLEISCTFPSRFIQSTKASVGQGQDKL